MYQPGEVARRICDRGGWTVTNLALQKILYMAQMLSLGREGRRLVDGRFEAWDYGPVQPELYRRVRMFGDKPIQDIFFSARRLEGPAADSIVEEVCDVLLPKRPGELVAISHWHGGAWAKNYRPGMKGIIMSDTDIADEYRARVASSRAGGSQP